MNISSKRIYRISKRNINMRIVTVKLLFMKSIINVSYSVSTSVISRILLNSSTLSSMSIFSTSSNRFFLILYYVALRGLLNWKNSTEC